MHASLATVGVAGGEQTVRWRDALSDTWRSRKHLSVLCTSKDFVDWDRTADSGELMSVRDHQHVMDHQHASLKDPMAFAHSEKLVSAILDTSMLEVDVAFDGQAVCKGKKRPASPHHLRHEESDLSSSVYPANHGAWVMRIFHTFELSRSRAYKHAMRFLVL